jgi:hypothetical protein
MFSFSLILCFSVFESASPVGDTEFEILRASNRRVVFALDRSNATSEQVLPSAFLKRLQRLKIA